MKITSVASLSGPSPSLSEHKSSTATVETDDELKDWNDLKFWETGEWQVIQERLEDLEKAKVVYNPARELLFAALDMCPLSNCRVCIIGQDPYPHHEMATGLAFSIPKKFKKYPPTLQNILNVYQTDLGLPHPEHGDLSAWAAQGVLLWNAIPTCEEGKPGSHKAWFEWDFLTKEIVETLSNKGIVFGLLGSFARAYVPYIDQDGNHIVQTGHPSPLGEIAGRDNPNVFSKSRFFSTVNVRLSSMKLGNIDWRL